MGIDVAGTLITGGTSIAVSDSSSNKLYQQSSSGIVSGPATSAGGALTPLFNVGYGGNGTGWIDFGSGWYKGAFSYTGGNGYYNVGSCYNTSTYRFTAPWTGMYLFRQLMALYYNNTAYSLYTHPIIGVNGSVGGIRRAGTPYRIRAYGSYASYGSDTDGCELLYLTAGDYAEAYYYVGTNMSGYGPYGSFTGTYLGS